MPAISNMVRPGFTTETHFSGAPLPLPMRVSAGFLVNGLSGKMRIQSLPPRLIKRVIATRDASIWRSVIQAHSIALSPYSPKDNSPPPQALPLRRPRICSLHFTFLGINIACSRFPLYPNFVLRLLSCRSCVCRFAFLLNLGSALRHVFALINPALHADDAVGRVGFRGAKVNVGTQRLQRQPTLQIPLFAGDFRAVQPAGHANLDALAAETQRRVNGLAHRAAECHALFELQRNRLRDQRCVELRTVHFLNVDVHFTLGALLHFLLELVDFRAFATDDDARTRRVNPHDELVGGSFDVDRADARALELVLQLATQLDVLVQQVGVVLVGVPARLPRLVVTEPKTVRVCLLSHSILFVCCLLPNSSFLANWRSELLLALLRSVLFAGQSLAHATRGTTHAFLRFRFGLVCL